MAAHLAATWEGQLLGQFSAVLSSLYQQWLLYLFNVIILLLYILIATVQCSEIVQYKGQFNVNGFDIIDFDYLRSSQVGSAVYLGVARVVQG